jgi:hypothetical protein
MIDTLSELYGLFISFLALSMAIGATVIWVIMIIDRRKEESFDDKYKRTRKHDGYKPGR